MKRRNFIAAGVAAAVSSSLVAAQAQEVKVAPQGGKFKLKYAPGFGQFEAHAGKNPVDQLKFMADQGFRAFFDNGLMKQPQLDKILSEAQRLNLEVGPFVESDFTWTPTFVLNDKANRDTLVKIAKKAAENAQRTNIKMFLIVLGAPEPKLSWEYQTANAIENLKWCTDAIEKTGRIMVLEPLNHRDHPGLFLTKIPQAYEICKAVNSPSCKILNDLYHQQITEGDLIPNIDLAWSEIGAFHLGDNPGRKEPTTGEINFRNIFKHIHGKGYEGVLCMEHGKSKGGKEGEIALLEAYRWCDAF